MDASLFVPGRRPPKLRRVTIEVTTWCNLKCPGCLRTIKTAQGLWSDKHMPKEVFARILDNLPPADLGILQGIGEPTLHPDYAELCRIASRSGKFDALYINTNGLARDPEHYLELKEAGLTGFYVSVDSLTPEIAARVRAGTNVEKLAGRLRRLRGLDLTVAISMVVSRENLHDVGVSLRALRDLGASSVNVGRLIGFDGGLEPLDQDERKALVGIVAEAQRDCPTMPISYFNDVERIAPYCVAPWLDPAVTVDGFLTPCCVNFDPDVFGGIDLSRVSYAEGWDSEAVQNFLRAYITEKPSFCNGCIADNRD
jgi:MoaA/NifB/PqqE/SkfB family radical SAM enzyme